MASTWLDSWGNSWGDSWGPIVVDPNAIRGTSSGTSTASATLTAVAFLSGSSSGASDASGAIGFIGSTQDTHDGIEPHIIKWWLDKHKKKKPETVQEALEIVQAVIQKPSKAQEVIAARDDTQLQLFIAQQIVMARQRIQQLEDDDEEEAILALLL